MNPNQKQVPEQLVAHNDTDFVTAKAVDPKQLLTAPSHTLPRDTAEPEDQIVQHRTPITHDNSESGAEVTVAGGESDETTQ